jgi:hypothetical protein
MAGLETCSAATIPARDITDAGKIYESLLKNQTGRLYSAPCSGPHRVLLPFLAEDLELLYHRRKYFTSPEGRAIPKIPKSATCSEYQSLPADAIAILGIFRPHRSEIRRIFLILLKSFEILIGD